MMDFLFPEIPEWKETKKILTSNILGNISQFKVEWKFLSYDLKNRINSWKTDKTQGGGALSHFCSHTFHYMEFFLGKIQSIDSAFSYSKKSVNHAETRVSMNVLFESGCYGQIDLDIAFSGTPIHKLEFFSNRGNIVLQNLTTNIVDGFELFLSTNDEKKPILPTNHFINVDPTEDPRIKAILPIAKRFIHWCENGISSKPDFEDGLRVQELIELTRNSHS